MIRTNCRRRDIPSATRRPALGAAQAARDPCRPRGSGSKSSSHLFPPAIHVLRAETSVARKETPVAHSQTREKHDATPDSGRITPADVIEPPPPPPAAPDAHHQPTAAPGPPPRGPAVSGGNPLGQGDDSARPMGVRGVSFRWSWTSLGRGWRESGRFPAPMGGPLEELGRSFISAETPLEEMNGVPVPADSPWMSADSPSISPSRGSVRFPARGAATDARRTGPEGRQRAAWVGGFARFTGGDAWATDSGGFTGADACATDSGGLTGGMSGRLIPGGHTRDAWATDSVVFRVAGFVAFNSRVAGVVVSRVAGRRFRLLLLSVRRQRAIRCGGTPSV